MTYTDDTESRTVSTLRLSARISESGQITHLPETIRPVRWTDLWARAGQSHNLERTIQLRVRAWVDPLLKAIETEAMPAEEAHRYKSEEAWRAAAIRQTRRRATDQAHAYINREMAREALAQIDAEGPAFWPVRWQDEPTIFLVQGEWTVTMCASGTDHQAVSQAFATELAQRAADVVADAHNRIPRPAKTVRHAVCPDTPAKVRKAWQRDRRKGTAPQPATGSYVPGSWVIWQDPVSGRTISGIVSQWTPGWSSRDTGKRGVIPSDGSDPVVMQLDAGADRRSGPWRVAYGEGVTARVKPGATQLERTV
ncbi:hypothetical protein [Streptomyces sp. NPDC059072]|uniref:hypothetical protein n=1 Tax=Streptomyces sp. NPDC059072 TaxID=3346715 RepID=UPI003683F495